MHIILGAVTLAVMIGALADIITRDEWQVKHLPKIVWIVLVILLPLVGSVLWFGVGREYSSPVDLGGFGDPRRGSRAERAPASHSVQDAAPMSQTERELARLEQEIAQAEQEERIRRLEREVEQRRAREQSNGDSR